VNSVTTNTGQRSRPAVFEGTAVTTVSEERPQPVSSGSGFDLNFENTPVATVAKVVLGDIMGTGYTIDPRVQGTVSLVSVRPVAKSDIVFLLEDALRLSGVVLIRDTAGYRLTPLGDAVGAGRVDASASSAEPGYGISVVPLQYVSAQTLLKLMDSFATKAGTVRADPTRNLLIVQGTGAERRTTVDTALSFDVDWMRGQSVGTHHRGTRKNRRFGRERPQPERRQVSAGGPPQRHHGGEQKAGAAAHGGDLDQTARHCGYRANQRSRLPGQIRRGTPDRPRAERYVHRRIVIGPARHCRQPDCAGVGHLRDIER
jgi:hypothetical protein